MDNTMMAWPIRLSVCIVCVGAVSVFLCSQCSRDWRGVYENTHIGMSWSDVPSECRKCCETRLPRDAIYVSDNVDEPETERKRVLYFSGRTGVLELWIDVRQRIAFKRWWTRASHRSHLIRGVDTSSPTVLFQHIFRWLSRES